MNEKTLCVKLPNHLYEKLKEESKLKNVSMASIVRIIFSEYFLEK